MLRPCLLFQPHFFLFSPHLQSSSYSGLFFETFQVGFSLRATVNAVPLAQIIQSLFPHIVNPTHNLGLHSNSISSEMTISLFMLTAHLSTSLLAVSQSYHFFSHRRNHCVQYSFTELLSRLSFVLLPLIFQLGSIIGWLSPLSYSALSSASQ